jgi:hypothetical protein
MQLTCLQQGSVAMSTVSVENIRIGNHSLFVSFGLKYSIAFFWIVAFGVLNENSYD